MFINQKILKRLMQRAYKGNGLYMANYDGYMYLSDPFAGTWAAKMAVGCVPKEILAMMVACAGRIPENGEGWTSDVEKDQIEAFLRYEEPKHGSKADVTPLYMFSPGGVAYRIVQLTNCSVLCVKPALLEAIDPASIDNNNEESMIEGPFYSGEDTLYARTNQATWVIRGGAPPRTEAIRNALEQTALAFDAEE